MDGKTFVLEASIDRRSNRVLLAACGKDFADILFTFLTMPLGSIVSLIRSQHPNFQLGCLSNLYDSVEKLDPGFVQNESCRTNLLNPPNLAISQCKNLITDGSTSYRAGSLNSNCTGDNHDVPCFCGSSRWYDMISYKTQSADGVFVKGQPRFVVSDELEVLPASTEACLSLLSKLGGIDGEMDFKCFTIGIKEVIKLMMLSLVSKTALTETLLRTEQSEGNVGVLSIGTLRVLGDLFAENQRIRIKLSKSRSTKKVLYAEANGDFINLLYSFLTIPLGEMVKEILYGDLSSVCIVQLYKSVRKLDPNEYFKSYKHRDFLLNPSLVNTIPLVLREQRINESRICEGFVKRDAKFSVSDHLRIGPISPVSILSAISKSSPEGLRDIEIKVVDVCRKEAICLLVASVFSENALDVAFRVCLPTQGLDKPTTSIQRPPSKKWKTMKARFFNLF